MGDSNGHGSIHASGTGGAPNRTLRYPLYLIASADGVLVLNMDGKDCVLLFHNKELAKCHIAETKALGATTPLSPLAVPNADAFREGLDSLPADITCAIWDATIVPRASIQIGLDELFRGLDGIDHGLLDD